MTNSENHVTGIGFNRKLIYQVRRSRWYSGLEKKISINCRIEIKTSRRRELIYSKATAAVITVLTYALPSQLVCQLTTVCTENQGFIWYYIRCLDCCVLDL
ncbi:hypothetical protein GQ457_06G024900 [Hibiscus cannabinus]